MHSCWYSPQCEREHPASDKTVSGEGEVEGEGGKEGSRERGREGGSVIHMCLKLGYG